MGTPNKMKCDFIKGYRLGEDGQITSTRYCPDGIFAPFGSSADNEIIGYWQQFSNGQPFTDAEVVTAMYPSVSTHFTFYSGHSPTTFTRGGSHIT